MELFRLEAFQEKLELSGVDFFTFDPVEDLEQCIDLLLQNAIAFAKLGNDAVFLFFGSDCRMLD